MFQHILHDLTTLHKGSDTKSLIVPYGLVARHLSLLEDPRFDPS